MFGPATGHNIRPFLDFFSNHSEYRLSLVYSGNNDIENNNLSTINYFKLSKSLLVIFQLIKKIRQTEGIIWHQGGYNTFELLLTYLFKKRKTLFIINVWGEHVPNIAKTKTLQGRMFKFFYKKCDIISCLWYGTKKILDDFIEPKKVVVLLWGLENTYFSEEEQELKDFTRNFINEIPKDKTTFFYPKSFTESSNHDGIIDAARILKNRGVDNFVVYFWTGNITRGGYEQTAKDKIKANNLDENIKIVYHDFLPFYDIIQIWKSMNVGLQIVKNDQLSTTFLEPLILKKEMLVSDIYPYQKITEHYPKLNLHLTINKPEVLADEMNELINGKRTSATTLENRKKIIEKEFNFEKNIQKMLDFYQELILTSRYKKDE